MAQLKEETLTSQIIGCAIEVHKGLGPGLLENAYEECLCYELSSAGLAFARQVALPVVRGAWRGTCGGLEMIATTTIGRESRPQDPCIIYCLECGVYSCARTVSWACRRGHDRGWVKGDQEEIDRFVEENKLELIGPPPCTWKLHEGQDHPH